MEQLQIQNLNTDENTGSHSASVCTEDFGPRPGAPYYSPSAAIAAGGRKPDSEQQEKRVRHFCFFGLGSLFYAVFYTICLYRNPSGITYPFFIGGTLFYFLLFLRKSGISAKKDSIFYMTALMLLGISGFCTDNGSILLMNKLLIFVLMFTFMVHSLYEDGAWDFSGYLCAVLRTVFEAVESVGRPFSDMGLYLKKRKELKGSKDTKGRYVALGLLVSIPLILVVLLLLGTADLVFASFLSNILNNIRLPENVFGLCFTLVFAFVCSYCVIAALSKKAVPQMIKDSRTGEPVLAVTVTGILSVIYLVFSGIQIVYLFMGKMTLPNGCTYSEYARQGFFQLLFVCLLNLALVLICLEKFRESRPLKVILTVISLCTYVMIASSAMRMIIYIKYCYLTFLRIFVLWSLLVIFLLMTGVLIHIYKQHFPLFSFCMVTVTVLYLALSFSHPDYWIARVNTSCMGNGKASDFFEAEHPYSDVDYLKSLSADAAPVLLQIESSELFVNPSVLYEPGYNGSWYSDYVTRMQKKGERLTLRSFNVSRYIAKRLCSSAG